MSTKIVSSESTVLKPAEIRESDLNKIINDFTELPSSVIVNGRTLLRIDTISMPLSILDDLLTRAKALEDHDAIVNINIKFGITLPDQKDCTDAATDISNQLTVVLMIEKNDTELNHLGDYILTPGFKATYINPLTSGSSKICCPGTGGKGGTH